MSLSEIRPGLFLGNLTSLRLVQTQGFTHVLSVMRDAPMLTDMNAACAAQQLCIDVADEEDEDLLAHFPAAIAFIRSALTPGGKLLVHCVAGVSRSATVVMAHLMAAEGLDAHTAFRSVLRLRPVVQPNEGFMEQLRVWEQMGGALQPDHAYVRQRALQALSEQHFERGCVDRAALAVPAEQPEGALERTLFRCRTCRRVVATDANVAPRPERAPGSGVPRFSGKRFSAGKDAGGGGESQVWVEPMHWMEEVVAGNLQGKLYCPGCRARLGSFNWAGMQDSRGVWVTPAFELQLGRLDAVPPAQQGAATRIHRPVLQ